jgi:hypothetical protein
MSESDVLNNDVVKYAIVAGGFVSTIVFANLLISKLHDLPHVKRNMNMALLFTGITVIGFGIVGSQYVKWKKKNGNANTETDQ